MGGTCKRMCSHEKKSLEGKKEKFQKQVWKRRKRGLIYLSSRKRRKTLLKIP
jgi:hypothetical protein